MGVLQQGFRCLGTRKVFIVMYLPFACFVWFGLYWCLPSGEAKIDHSWLDIYWWKQNREVFCGGNYIGYGNMFFKLHRSVYDPFRDTFALTCPVSKRPTDYRFDLDYYAPTRYTKSLEYVTGDLPLENARVENKVTIVIFREYPHNFYHAMTQWYNIYLVSKLLNLNWLDVHVLLLDRGPVVHIDEQWDLLFPRVTKAHNLTNPVQFKDAIFNIAGHSSPMYLDNLSEMFNVDEFTEDILRKFNLRNNKTLDCNNLTVTLVLRHDYYFHPGVDKIKRNTERKFKNEAELISTLNSVFPGHSVRLMVSETMPLREQIELAVQTDIFIAMHGCALTHTLFLPKHATILEMYPIFWKRKFFFSSIAKWRQLRFTVWQNTDKNAEFPDHYTYVPPKVLVEFGSKAVMDLNCRASFSFKLQHGV